MTQRYKLPFPGDTLIPGNTSETLVTALGRLGYLRGPKLVDFVVEGEPASKSNSRRAFRAGKSGRRFFAKSAKAEDYGTAFRRQCPAFFPALAGDLFALLQIHYASRRPDLDPSLIFDLMQGLVYTNDRQVKRQFLLHALDRERPRCRIAIWACG